MRTKSYSFGRSLINVEGRTHGCGDGRREVDGHELEIELDRNETTFRGLLPLALGGLERVSRLRNLLTGAVTEVRQDPALGPVFDLAGGAAYECDGKQEFPGAVRSRQNKKVAGVP